MKVAKEVDPKSACHKEKNIVLFFCMRDVNKTYCGNHFTISQIIILHTLNYIVLYVNYISIKPKEKNTGNITQKNKMGY